MSGSGISRKDFLKLGGAGLGAMALDAALPRPGGRRARAAGSSDRPNMLFICMDQLQSWTELPDNLPLAAHHRLLREGRGFARYHVHQGPCGPSRSTFYTGQHVQKTGVYTNPTGEYVTPDGRKSVQLPVGFPTIGTMLRQEGYYTSYKGKWHLSDVNQEARLKAGPNGYPNAAYMLEPYGFSDYNADGEHSGLTWVGFGHDGFIAADAANLLYKFSQGYSEGKPWFLAVNFVNPHDIMWYDPKGGPKTPQKDPGPRLPILPEPHIPFYEVDWKEPLPESLLKDDLSTKPPVQKPRITGGPFGGIARTDLDDWRRYRNYYFNCVRDVDRHIVTLLDALDRFGLADNTIVFMTADHGEQNGAHGMKGKGADMYKETVHVPLIVRHPDVKGGRQSDALGGSIDLAPTILGFAGVSDSDRATKYPDLHGVDLGPVVADAGATTKRDERGILFNYMTASGLTPTGPNPKDHRRGLVRGVHEGKYKFARYFATAEHHIPKDWETLTAHNDLELYDTEADPNEITNLAFKPEGHKDLILKLNAKVNNLIAEEVGKDDGAIYPGPTEAYDLKT